MKRLITVIFLLSTLWVGAQTGSKVQVEPKLKDPKINSDVPMGKTSQFLNDTIDAKFDEINTELDSTFKIADAVEGYTAAEINAIIYNSELQNIINNANGTNYRFPVLANLMSAVGVAMTDGRAYLIGFDLKEPYTTSGVSWAMTSTTANYTQTTAGEKNHIILHSWDAGTLTPIDSTVNDRDMWKTGASILSSKNWKGGSHTLAAGRYYVEYIWTATTTTTAPTLGVLATANTAMLTIFFPANAQPTIFLGSQTTAHTAPFSIASGWSQSTSSYLMILKP